MCIRDRAKRAGRGLQVLRELKTKPHRVFTAGPVFTENAGAEIDLLATPVEETPQILFVICLLYTSKIKTL